MHPVQKSMDLNMACNRTKGIYTCELCNVTCTSASSLNEHFKGKKHKAKESVRLNNLGIEYVRKKSNVFSKCELCDAQFVDVMGHVNSSMHILKYMETRYPETFKNIKCQGLKSFSPEQLKRIMLEIGRQSGNWNLNIYAEDALWMGEMFGSNEIGPKKKLENANCLKSYKAGKKPPMANTTCQKSMATSTKPTKGNVTGKEDEPPKKKQRTDLNSDTVGKCDLEKDVFTTTSICDAIISTSGKLTKKTRNTKEKCYQKESDRGKATNCESEQRNHGLCSNEGRSNLKEPMLTEPQQADPRIRCGSGQQCSITQPSAYLSAMNQNLDHLLDRVKRDPDTVSSSRLQTSPTGCATCPTGIQMII
ncbi:uncharacterized protein LOC128497658 [Spea bombifrons]|uniref:uncharacterized protein LOC128497658 n=1 Tax=Spea bombifrons TaxID=233779 RepID=UPI00234959A9|nr:uncharacterized protein LOC128497658 [Spea bombifrons]